MPTLALPSQSLTPGQTTASTSSPLPAATATDPVFEPDVVVDCDVPLADEPIAWGTNGWWTDQDDAVWRAKYAELAPSIVRLPLLHGFLEPVNDDQDPSHVNRDGFRFTEPVPWFGRTITYERWFGALRDLNVTLMLHVPYLASWLGGAGPQEGLGTFPPRPVAEYEEFVEATLRFLVQEIEYPPERIMLEPVNEPDLRCGQDPAVPCFWSDWSMGDLVDVVRAARRACDAVHPAIRLVGLSTCCDHTLVDQLMDVPGGTQLLDGLTYHSYIHGFDQSEALEVGRRLSQWGLPVYINEYGSPRYWSNGTEGALWHASALAQIWSHAIVPVQFSMSEFPGMHRGYNQLGLFTDWEHGFEEKPAYEVYVGFAHYLGATVPVSSTAQTRLIVAAGRGEDGQVAIWVVNADQDDQLGTTFRVDGSADDTALVTVHPAAAASDPLATITATGMPLSFAYDVPAASVLVFVLTPTDSVSTPDHE